MKVRFVLICEGSSDSALVSHLEAICVEHGAEEASGIAPEWERLGEKVSKRVEDRLAWIPVLEPDANLIFVHRDSDSRESAHRHAEIATAAEASGIHVPVVAVVPVQETEAWLLLDESAIRDVAGNPYGKEPLGLPTSASVERIANPKERLAQALITASERSGRKLEKFKKDFPKHRFLLLQRLDRTGPVSDVLAWQKMLEDAADALKVLT